jgi:RimJ/RimL family protein N-acetyltransferase
MAEFCDMTDAPFVPADFEPPTRLETPDFLLEPLGPQHNESDYAAWTSSVDHIHATPGFAEWAWPVPMTLEENLGDMVEHAQEFADRVGFTFTVLDPGEGSVIGCVYIYPAKRDPAITSVRSWVRADRAELDAPLHDAVARWLAEAWPFATVDYAPRG